MALFELNSKITIGTQIINGVHDVHIKRGLHGYSDVAAIKLPSIGSMQAAKFDNDGNVVLLPSSASPVTTGNLWDDGEDVKIELGYNGDLREEFRGFIKRRDLAMPLMVECEGYSYVLRNKVSITGSFKRTSAKQLLELACEGTGITVECPVDFPLSGIKLNKADGTKIIDHIKKCSDNTLTIFFKDPTTLWCGLVYTPYLAGSNIYNLPTVKYRLGWNVLKDSGLKERIPSEPVQIIINGKTVTGDTVRTESKDATAKRHVQFLLNNVPDEQTLHAFAQEKQLNMNYTGYEGKITAFLQPYAAPGYNAYIVDGRYPERNGTYIIESTEVRFSVQGARRVVEIGPKLG